MLDRLHATLPGGSHCTCPLKAFQAAGVAMTRSWEPTVTRSCGFAGTVLKGPNRLEWTVMHHNHLSNARKALAHESSAARFNASAGAPCERLLVPLRLLPLRIDV
jgi:hypothetical protein